jgi:phosphate transport system ATP-binding protein
MDRESTQQRAAEGQQKAGEDRLTSQEGGKAGPQRAGGTSSVTAQTMEVQNLSAYYNKFKAVTDVSMKIEPNKVTALIGPSGCGKSTFIRTLNRMHEIARGGRIEGKVLLDGEDIYDDRVDPVQVMVFQKPNPFPTMSVYDNVVAGLKLERRHKKSELDEVVEKMLRQAALWDEVKDKLSANGTDLSGGQQQRLCIARTLALEPQVILLDEPASALDPMSSQKIEDAMQELKERYTIVIVTHNMQQASRSSDYTGFFFIEDMGQPGQLWEFGETSKMFSNPERQETEDYVTGRFG